MTPDTPREEWLRLMPELVMLCNEAVDRTGRAEARAGGAGEGAAAAAQLQLDAERHKPIDLEYLADRLDTDGARCFF
jgi:hypothetical protein